MLKIYFSLILLSFGLIVQNCSFTTPQNSNAEISGENSPSPTSTPQNENLPQSAKVEFKGVSFAYNPQIFSEMKSEVAEQPLEYETDIPDNVAPQHLLFKLKVQNLKEFTIAVYPIEEFRRVWLPVEKNSTLKFDYNLKNVKKFIENKNFRVNGEIPYLPYTDGIQTFEAKVKHVSFPSGNGVFYLTQGVQEEAIINNGHLEYDFQGVSADGKYYILAQSSVNVSFLPDNYHVSKFEDYTMPDHTNWSKSERKKYNEYVLKVAKRLKNLPQNEFEPNLDEFEKIISTLKIEN